MFLKVAQEQVADRGWWRGLCGQKEGVGGRDRERRAKKKRERDTRPGERQTESRREAEGGAARETGVAEGPRCWGQLSKEGPPQLWEMWQGWNVLDLWVVEPCFPPGRPTHLCLFYECP